MCTLLRHGAASLNNVPEKKGGVRWAYIASEYVVGWDTRGTRAGTSRGRVFPTSPPPFG